MPNLAKFTTAPSGTECRNSPWDSWTTAVSGDILTVDGSESRNTSGTDYEMQLFADAAMFFDTLVSVDLRNITGTVKCRDANGHWTTVTVNKRYTVTAVGTDNPGGVSVICGFQGLYRPKPIGYTWP